MFNEPALYKVIGMSVLSKKRFFALSALATHDLDKLTSLRDTVWSTHKKESEGLRSLATTSLCFPWAESPAHALFVNVIEQWTPHELEMMLWQELEVLGGTKEVTRNAHLSDIVYALANPQGLGTTEFKQKLRYKDLSEIMRPLLRAYILDPIFQAPDRRKLGLVRPLTTQDRYELLACIWRCQQGVSLSPSHTRVWVMIDHAEHLLEYPLAERRLFTNGLLTLLSNLQSYFTLWLNITQTDVHCINDVKKACGISLLEQLDADCTQL